MISGAQQDQSRAERAVGQKLCPLARGHGQSQVTLQGESWLIHSYLTTLPSCLLTHSWCLLLAQPHWKEVRGIPHGPHPISVGVTQPSNFHQFNWQEGVAPCGLNWHFSDF